MLILIILASCLPAIFAIAQYLENAKKEKETKKYETELKSQIESLILANSQLSSQITTLSKIIQIVN